MADPALQALLDPDGQGTGIIIQRRVDDAAGTTLASASSLEKTSRESLKTGATVEAATVVGKLIAERASAAGIKEVVFDRGAYMYHGRVKALAESAREGGLTF